MGRVAAAVAGVVHPREAEADDGRRIALSGGARPQLVQPELLLQRAALGHEVGDARVAAGVRVAPLDRDPEERREGAERDEAQALAGDGRHLPIHALLAAEELAPVLVVEGPVRLLAGRGAVHAREAPTAALEAAGGQGNEAEGAAAIAGGCLGSRRKGVRRRRGTGSHDVDTAR